MSKQEVKEEFKQQEGDPQIKGKIRQKQRQMAMSRMMQEVPKADVIITNPTHFAVALKYESGMTAPVVLAKGQDAVAQKLRALPEIIGFLLWKTSLWPEPSMLQLRWEVVCLRNCSRQWQRFWHMYTSLNIAIEGVMHRI